MPRRGDLVHVKVCRDAPRVSSLLSTDDFPVLMGADRQNAECLKKLSGNYCAAS